MDVSDTPGIMYFIYACLFLSLLCYIFLMTLLIMSKAYKIFTFRLIICYIFSNTVLVVAQILFAFTRGSILEQPRVLINL